MHATIHASLENMFNKNNKDSQDFILHALICIKFRTGKLINSDRNQIIGYLAMEREVAKGFQEIWGIFGYIYSLDQGDDFTGGCICQNLFNYTL